MSPLGQRIEKIKERYPTLDERLERYRRDRERYDKQRDGRAETQKYPPQRGLRRGYRV